MQSLWSRIGQAKCNCKCPSCTFTKAALARRGATTGRGQFIKPITQSATFTYSAILAGAVAIDGGIKQHRRQKLNTELFEAKDLLDPSPFDRARQECQSDHDPLVSEDKSAEQMFVRDVQEPGDQQSTSDDGGADVEILDGISWLEALEYDVHDGRKPTWPRNFGPNVNSRQLPPQSLWAGDAAAEEAAARSWTPRKLRTLELAVGYFILETLIKNGLYADGPGKERQIPASLEQWRSMTHFQLVGTARSLEIAMWEVRRAKPEEWEAVYRRQTGFIPQLSRGMPHYEQDVDGNFRAVQKQLNMSLWTAMNQAIDYKTTDAHQDLAAKVCHDLLTSSAPPTHKSINLLLSGFTKLGDTISAEEVRKLMAFAHVRLNERTCVAVLNHYTLSSDVEGFTEFVQKMRGHFGGLMLARPDLEINEGNSRLLLVKPNAESRKIVQRVAPTPLVLEAIIAGLLKLVGFDTSLQLVGNLQREGWGLDKKSLDLFLRDCLKARDFSNGRRIWEQIKLLGALGPADADRCATMLRLCLDCANESEFRTIFEEVKHKVAHPRILKEMVIQQTDVAGKKGRKTLLSMKHAIRRMRDLNVSSDVSEELASASRVKSTADSSSHLRLGDGSLLEVSGTLTEAMHNIEALESDLNPFDLRERPPTETWEGYSDVEQLEEEQSDDNETTSWSPTTEYGPTTSQASRSDTAPKSGPWRGYVSRMRAPKLELSTRNDNTQNT